VKTAWLRVLAEEAYAGLLLVVERARANEEE